jgi:glycosyltransferase involved in cell wall biosynthesis
MRIGIDASRTTLARRTGTERYALELIRALLAECPADELRLYFREAPPAGLFASSQQKVIPFPRLWTHIRLNWELLRARPDVLFVPAHVVPLGCPVRAVVTVHDLGYRLFPDAHPLRQRLYLDWSTAHSARAAARVLADSQATKRDLVRFYGISAGKIVVVYPGRNEALAHVDPAPVLARHGLDSGYLLHVGTLQPRKNLLRLMQAVSQVSPRPALVLAGRVGWQAEPILAAAQQTGTRVLDYVADEDLASLYSGAAAFVFPSLYEGFGFPVLEAMACRTPVICSNTSSLPELAGEAALQVDPEDVGALTSAIQRLLGDRALRAALAERGEQQIRKFSWARAAREARAVLEAAVE